MIYGRCAAKTARTGRDADFPHWCNRLHRRRSARRARARGPRRHGARKHERLVFDGADAGLRTIVLRPGVVYGGGNGIIADLFKPASNGLVRVIGDGNNPWPLVYERHLADLYARIAARDDAAGIYHANDEGDERVNDIVDAIKPYLPVKPDVRYVPIDEARNKMG